MRYRIKELIIAKRAALGRKITLQEIANETGVSQPMLSKLGSTSPPNITAKKLEALCKYFGVSPNDFMIIESSGQSVSGVKVKPGSELEISMLSPETLYVEKRFQDLEGQNKQMLEILQRMEDHLEKRAKGKNPGSNCGNPHPKAKTEVKPPKTLGDIVVIGKPQRGGTLVIGHCLPMDELPHPLEAKVGFGANLYFLIFTPLIGMEAGEPVAALAYDWRQVGSSWIFNLYEGVKFHNGDELTAHDVKLTYEELMKRKPDSPVEAVKTLDDYTVQFVLENGCTPESFPTIPILPQGRFSSAQPVGTGPFQVVQLNPDSWRLKAHRRYFRGNPFLSEVHIRRYNDSSELEDALTKGDVHLAVGIASQEEGFVTKYESGVQRYELVFMMDYEICRNENFRQAIYYGLDRAAIAEAAGINNPKFATGAYDYILDERAFIEPKSDFQKAKELLGKIPEIETIPFRVAFPQGTYPEEKKIAHAIVAQLLRLGIPAELGSDGQAMVVTFNTQTPALEHNIWHSAGCSNIGKYSNPDVDKLLKRLKNTYFDKEIFKRLQAIIRTDSPTVPLFYREDPVAYVKSLRALENRMILIRFLDEIHTWYFEAEYAIEQLVAEAIA